LQQFAARINVRGAENIPGSGPLLIVSNHVGAFDMLAITSQINRDDVKIIAGEVALLHNFPALGQRLIFTTFQPGSGMQAARQALRHLRDGGALLLFASAGIDPDPALDLPAARQELQKWKPSIDIFLQHAPQTKVVVSIVRGVAAPNWARHPLTRIGKRPIDRRRIGEILQILEQLFFPGKRMMEPHISFSRALSSAELQGDARAAVIRVGEELLFSQTSL
jgi:1-acyl-sn-glycerol-3-phosphate acyltransferase